MRAGSHLYAPYALGCDECADHDDRFFWRRLWRRRRRGPHCGARYMAGLRIALKEGRWHEQSNVGDSSAARRGTSARVAAVVDQLRERHQRLGQWQHGATEPSLRVLGDGGDG
jgi:hypothetical protein